MEPTRESLSPELARLIELGKQKKLWSIVIRYTVYDSNEPRLMNKRNLEATELMNFRELMFRYGFKVEVEPGHWKIICPFDIVEVDLYQQDAYFFEAPYNPGK